MARRLLGAGSNVNADAIEEGARVRASQRDEGWQNVQQPTSCLQESVTVWTEATARLLAVRQRKWRTANTCSQSRDVRWCLLVLAVDIRVEFCLSHRFHSCKVLHIQLRDYFMTASNVLCQSTCDFRRRTTRFVQSIILYRMTDLACWRTLSISSSSSSSSFFWLQKVHKNTQCCNYSEQDSKTVKAAVIKFRGTCKIVHVYVLSTVCQLLVKIV